MCGGKPSIESVGYSEKAAFCPLVCLNPDAPLSLSANPIITTSSGSSVELTKDNVDNYLGKVVTNYKDGVGTESVNGKVVSKKYRLYYVDFDNIFGDGAGTIYLKADNTSRTYNLPTDNESDTGSTVKIKNLNPLLYKTGITAPVNSNNNMKAVTWLLNTSNWTTLVDSGAPTDIGSYINYVVGGPSVEMMMESYKMKYKRYNTYLLTGTWPSRPDLNYKFTSGASGYQVSPSATGGFGSNTKNNSLESDETVGNLYNPGSTSSYWLASPSTNGAEYVSAIRGDEGGRVDYGSYSGNTYSICPIVSVKRTAPLELDV